LEGNLPHAFDHWQKFKQDMHEIGKDGMIIAARNLTQFQQRLFFSVEKIKPKSKKKMGFITQ